MFEVDFYWCRLREDMWGETFTRGAGDEMWLRPLTLEPAYCTCFRIMVRDD
jgi:hypothetical protein